MYVILFFLALFMLKAKNEDPASGPASSPWKAYEDPAPGVFAVIEFCPRSEPKFCHTKWVCINKGQTYSLSILITVINVFIVNKTLKGIHSQYSSTLRVVIM
jgi:hypothetical protein